MKTRRLLNRQSLPSASLRACAHPRPGTSCLGAGAQPNAGEDSCQRPGLVRKSSSPKQFLHRRRRRGFICAGAGPSNATIIRGLQARQSLRKLPRIVVNRLRGLHFTRRDCATPLLHMERAGGKLLAISGSTCSALCSLVLLPRAWRIGLDIVPLPRALHTCGTSLLVCSTSCTFPTRCRCVAAMCNFSTFSFFH